MNKPLPLVAIAGVSVVLLACSAPEPAASTPGTTQSTGSPVAQSASRAPATPRPATPTPAPPLCPVPATTTDPCRVPATANIFGAGHQFPPAPAGGGRGTLPPTLALAADARTVTFPGITGQVNPIKDNGMWNGPEGDKKGPTDVESFDGISGIVDGQNGMFLVGVFLSDAEPADPAPERLDFTGREEFVLLEPAIAQVFYVGDGAGRSFRIPASATRLFLGFADAALYDGPPGWYGNNDGGLTVTVATSPE